MSNLGARKPGRTDPRRITIVRLSVRPARTGGRIRLVIGTFQADMKRARLQAFVDRLKQFVGAPKLLYHLQTLCGGVRKLGLRPWKDRLGTQPYTEAGQHKERTHAPAHKMLNPRTMFSMIGLHH